MFIQPRLTIILSSSVSYPVGFPGSLDGKKFACNAGDSSSIPGLGRSPGIGTGYPLQYSWASLVAQMVKNPPAMQETWVPSLGWEDPLEEGMVAHSSVFAWRPPWTEEPGGLQPTGSQSWTRLSSAPTLLCRRHRFIRSSAMSYFAD